VAIPPGLNPPTSLTFCGLLCPVSLVFGLFYRWDGGTVTVITLEHTAQDLPSRLASVLAAPEK
jgi:hypothetical protein